MKSGFQVAKAKYDIAQVSFKGDSALVLIVTRLDSDYLYILNITFLYISI